MDRLSCPFKAVLRAALNVQGASMTSKNYGLGYREMGRAGQIALERACAAKSISFATAAKYGHDWKLFCAWAKERGAKQMERITPDMVRQYGRDLASKADDSILKPSTAQDRVTAVNRVMQFAGSGWTSISSTKDCGISERSHVRVGAPAALDRSVYQARLASVNAAASPRGVAICELARNLGLRSKEASLFDANAGLKEARERGCISISDGTKGGRGRELPITSEAQIRTLELAAQAQGSARAVMPADQNWKQWRQGELRTVREAMGGLHELRSAYACERYAEITGHAAPCTGGQILDRDVDRGARLVISQELGHGRIDVAAEYLGGRK